MNRVLKSWLSFKVTVRSLRYQFLTTSLHTPILTLVASAVRVMANAGAILATFPPPAQSFSVVQIHSSSIIARMAPGCCGIIHVSSVM